MQRILLMHKRFPTVFKHTSTVFLQCLFAAPVGDTPSEQAVYGKQGLQLLSELQRHVDNLSVRAHLKYQSLKTLSQPLDSLIEDQLLLRDQIRC